MSKTTVLGLLHYIFVAFWDCIPIRKICRSGFPGHLHRISPQLWTIAGQFRFPVCVPPVSWTSQLWAACFVIFRKCDCKLMSVRCCGLAQGCDDNL